MNVMLDDYAYMPTRAHATDAGLDIRAQHEQIVPAHGSAVFRTGVHVELPKGMAGLLVAKSGLNVNHGIESTGLIDEGYTGEIKVKLYNHSEEDYTVERGDKISQLVIIPVNKEPLELVQKFKRSERGNNGFGSTGK